MTVLCYAVSPSVLDLLILGSGDLGTRLATLYKHHHPFANIYCETRTETRHAHLRSLGFIPRLAGQPFETGNVPRRVAVTVSASGSNREGFVEVIRRAASIWRTSMDNSDDTDGCLIYTSSTGVYAEDAKAVMTENSALAENGNDHVERLKQSERSVLDVGGNVIRCGGLYHYSRGPHRFLKDGKVPVGKSYKLHFVSYDDAAAMCLKAIERNDLRGQAFLCVEDRGVAMEEVIESAGKTRVWKGMKVESWGENESSRWREVDNSWSRKVLGWKPKYSTFVEYMREHEDAALEEKVEA